LELEKYLNPQQIKAVKSTEKPLLVIAGAGSGKTRVLTYRIAYLIKNKGVDPFNILAITFTNKAAKEMKRRVIELVGRIGEYMWVSTFHSFCARLLRYEIHRLGMSRNYVIYDADDSLNLISSIEKEMDMDIKKFPPKAVQSIISDAKNKLIDYETFSKRATDYFEKAAAEVYQTYQEKLFKANALDFDDLLLFTVDILNMYPEVRKKYQEKFKYILVDEFQDTNIAQNEIVLLLAREHQRICVVGDDDQSIYSWRGAEIKNIINFEKQFVNTEVIRLEQNYRSTKNILNVANCIIKNNKNRKEKKLWTENLEGEPVSKYMASDEKEEVDFVLRKIEEYMREKNKKYRDFAIFYRTNAQSRAVEETLIRRNIPYKIYGGLRFYDRKEIKDMLAYMKLVVNPKDVVSLMRIVNVPRRKIGKSTISIIEKYSVKNKMTFCEAFYRSSEINLLGESTKERINDFISLMADLRDYSMKNGVSRVLKRIWEKTGYMKELEQENTIEALNRIENLKELLTVTMEYDDNFKLNSIVADLSASDRGIAGSAGGAGVTVVVNAADKGGTAGKSGKSREVISTDEAGKAGETGAVSATGEIEATGGNGLENGLYNLDGFLEEVSLLTDIDNYDESTDSLVLMTLHNAKGLEFPVVFIIGMEEGIFPHSRSMNSVEELEEERRLCYVGITRAMKKVFLTSSIFHSIYGDTGYRIVSRFVNEINPELVVDENKAELRDRKDWLKIHKKDYIDMCTYKKGDVIEHKYWGQGEVLNVKKLPDDCEIDVMFESAGLKHLLVSFAPIKKIE
jgi:DNA helicase-2/ATP-dependent DNA helicase PcrA